MQAHRREAVSHTRLLAAPQPTGPKKTYSQLLDAFTYKYMHTSPTRYNRGLRVRHDSELLACSDNFHVLLSKLQPGGAHRLLALSSFTAWRKPVVRTLSCSQLLRGLHRSLVSERLASDIASPSNYANALLLSRDASVAMLYSLWFLGRAPSSTTVTGCPWSSCRSSRRLCPHSNLRHGQRQRGAHSLI